MTWDGDISRMGQLQERVADLAQIPSRVAKRVAFEIEGFLAMEFDEGADPYGTAWKPLAPATEAKGRSAPPLTDTGAMRGSLRVRAMRGSGVAISIDHPAAPHQTGWSGAQGTGPARPILPNKTMPPLWEEAIQVAAEDEFRRAG